MGVLPMYTIHDYSGGIYKVVAFKGVRDTDVLRVPVREPESFQHTGAKLSEAYSRAKSMVLQYALCNKWDYFVTCTVDKQKLNRYDLDAYQQRLSQFIRDKRKAYGTQIQYLLIPEKHEDGAWHFHGLLAGIPSTALRKFRYPEPKKLVNSDYLNWPDYMYKFGFCSLGPIDKPIGAAFYITKYMNKGMAMRDADLGKHLYFHSRPLKKAMKASDVYLYNSGLDLICDHDHDFCKTGMVQGVDWFFPYRWDGAEPAVEMPLHPPKPLQPEPDFHPQDIDPFYEQQTMEGFS